MLIGNPGDPAFSKIGVFSSPNAWCSLRLAVLEDYTYRQRFRDEPKIRGSDPSQTLAHFATHAALVTLNLEERIDFYGIFGTSRLQLNQEIYSDFQFSWGFGGKIVLFRTESFFISTDIKYFSSAQEPRYFICEGLPLNLVNLSNGFYLNYAETQYSLGMCLSSFSIAPYIYATYVIAKIDPNPSIALVRWPLSQDILIDIPLKSMVGFHRWGMAVGATLIDGDKSMLSVESRMFNENAVDINFSLRF